MSGTKCMVAVAAILLPLLCMAADKSTHNDIRTTIVYDDAATEVSSAGTDTGQLWINTVDLTRSTHFEMKLQGVCRDKLCFPIPRAHKQEFVRKDAGRDLFNLTAFANLVGQPVAHDAALNVWYFGLRSDQRQTLSSLQAPDFTLPDINGKMHSLSDFRGKKVFLVTWASW